MATNIIVPIHADAVYFNGKKMNASQPFDQAANKDSVVGCARRQGGGGVCGSSRRTV